MLKAAPSLFLVLLMLTVCGCQDEKDQPSPADPGQTMELYMNGIAKIVEKNLESCEVKELTEFAEKNRKSIQELYESIKTMGKEDKQKLRNKLISLSKSLGPTIKKFKHKCPDHGKLVEKVIRGEKP